MGLLDGLLGHGSDAAPEAVAQELDGMLVPGETVQVAFRVIRDLMVFTDRRLILVDKQGKIVGKYRKIHLPGVTDYKPGYPFQNLEKRYFEVGNLGFPVWETMGGRMGLAICNDRRWPETYRVMGLQGVELVMLGYNTPVHNPAMPETDDLGNFHNHLSMQSGAYQNGTWVVGVAKGGTEEGVPSLADSMIVAPSGKVVARAAGSDDELIVHRCDLDAGQSYKRTTFNFEVHRQPDAYKMIVERKGALDP